MTKDMDLIRVRNKELEKCLEIFKSILDSSFYTVETPHEEELYFRMAKLGYVVKFDKWLRPNKGAALSLMANHTDGKFIISDI